MANHSDGVPAAAISSGPTPTAPIGRDAKPLPAEIYSYFLSDAAKARQPSPIRGLYPLEKRPGMLSLLAGQPNPSTFPITSISFSARSPSTGFGPDASETTLTMSPESVAAGLQYGATAGYAPMLEWTAALQEREHGRKEGEGWRVTMGVGSQDLIYKAINATINPGDPIFVESPVYAGVIPLFEGFHCEQIEVATDADGISSSSLRKTLDSWPSGKPKPRILYTTPYGCNPTGMTATLERREEVLQLAREHNFLILEDDPYYYLYYGTASRPPSYFALERTLLPEVGRVIRCDSLSKILSAGIRIGFASGPKAILDAMDLHSALSNLQTPGLTQSIAHTLLAHWGHAGFVEHTRHVSAFYRGKRDVFERALERHLGGGLAEWTRPEAGMFFWFKLNLPRIDGQEPDSEALIRTNALAAGVLALPGNAFLPGKGRRTGYVRASFSLLGEADVEEACRRLGNVVREARGE